MLTRIIDWCLTYRPAVLLAAACLVVMGIASFQALPFDAFPDTTPVQVQVNTSAPALSPEEIERQITFEVEQAISGLPGLTQVRSVSKFGFSQVVATFEDGTDVYLARQTVSERVGAADLPGGVRRPSLGPVATGLGEVFQYVLTSEDLSPQELRTLHHWVVRPQLVQTPGVAEVNTWGGQLEQLHVVIDPDLLVTFELTLDDVARALRGGNQSVGGGALEVAGESVLVRGDGLARTAEDLASIVVATSGGVAIRVGDVAQVRRGHELRRGAVTVDGRGEAVLGLGFMLMGENSREVTRALERRLEQARRSVPAGVEITPVYRRTDLVDQVLSTVRANLLEAALLVIAVLFVLLGDLRAGLIVAAVIPLSMLFAFNAMVQFGIVGSLMSLGAIDFGLVVDSSVIVVENASRRLAQDESGRSVREIVRDAAVEVRRPTLFGELIVAAVYLPILTLEGVEGRLFRPMALTVIFALMGSMLVSVTLTPVLASYALRRGVVGHGAGRLVGWLGRLYGAALERALRAPALVIGVAALVVVNAGLLATTLGAEFVPRLREQAVVINTVRIAGISLDESVRYGTLIERRLLEEFPDEIEHVWTRTGTGEVATDPMGLEVSDVFITLTPRARWTRGRTQDELTARMRASLEGMPGMRSIFTQPIQMRVDEMLSGIRADVGVKIYGDDFDELAAASERVRQALTGVEGAADVTAEQLTGQAVLEVEVDRAAAGRLGVPVEDVMSAVESLGTRRVGEVFEGQRRFDLVLRLSEEDRGSVEAIERLLIRTAAGVRVPLGQVARVSLREGPSTIQREWARRRVTVQANVEGRDVASFVEEVRARLDEVELPQGYYMTLGGEFENLERAARRLTLVLPLTLLLVFTLLYLTYGRAADALRVFTGVPFGAVGGVVALWARGLPLSVSAAVGFVALSGVAVLGDIVLVSRIRDLEAEGMQTRRAVREAAVTRMRPVLMTSLVAALGFVPMALNTGVGAEVQRPLATVVIGGMLTSTLATLLVLPVLYSAFAPRAEDEP
jgi:cobalt-zinc-cadmium resistance protein CzcA